MVCRPDLYTTCLVYKVLLEHTHTQFAVSWLCFQTAMIKWLSKPKMFAVSSSKKVCWPLTQRKKKSKTSLVVTVDVSI